MKKTLLCVPVVALVIFFGKLVWDSGKFYQPKKFGFEQCSVRAKTPGAEDLAIWKQANMVIISSDTRPNHGEEATELGNIFGLRANGSIGPLLGKVPTAFHPHGIDLYENGREATLFAISHRGGESVIEVFRQKDSLFFPEKTISDPTILTPNDVLATGPNSFYLTQDHGSRSHFWQSIEHFTRVGRGSLAYVEDGKITPLVTGISFANGLALDPVHKLLYVAATLEKAVRVYRIGDKPTELSLLKKIALSSGPDNLTVDTDGNLWIAAHANMFALKKHSEKHVEQAPSQILRVREPWLDSHRVQTILEDDGTTVSSASTALSLNDRLYIGAIYEAKLLECSLPRSY